MPSTLQVKSLPNTRGGQSNKHISKCFNNASKLPIALRTAPLLSRTWLVELAQPLLDLGELLLRLLDDLLEVVEALVVVLDVLGPVGALVRAKVLDLLAAVLDFCHAERCARAFQEVAERR